MILSTCYLLLWLYRFPNAYRFMKIGGAALLVIAVGCLFSDSLRGIAAALTSKSAQDAIASIPLAWGTESVLRFVQAGTMTASIPFLAGAALTGLLGFFLGRWHRRAYARTTTEKIFQTASGLVPACVPEQHDPARMDLAQAEQIVRERMRDDKALLYLKTTWCERLLWRCFDRRQLERIVILRFIFPIRVRQTAILVLSCLLIGLMIPSWAGFAVLVLTGYLILSFVPLGLGSLALTAGQPGRTGIKALAIYPVDMRETVWLQAKLYWLGFLVNLPLLIGAACVLLSMGEKAKPAQVVLAGAFAAFGILTVVPYLSVNGLVGRLPVRGWGYKVFFWSVTLIAAIPALMTTLFVPLAFFAGMNWAFWVILVLVIQAVLPGLVVRLYLWFYVHRCDWVVRESMAHPHVTVLFSGKR
jgi:hypothetical protein